MIPFDRSDGKKLTRLPPIQAVMPYLMRGRNESAVYFSKDIDVENALKFVHAKNADLESRRAKQAVPETKVHESNLQHEDSPTPLEFPKKGEPVRNDAEHENSDNDRYSLFSFVLCAAARVLELRPRLDRFVHRRGIYQRKDSSISFIVKKRLSVDAEETSAKVYIGKGMTLEDGTQEINSAIKAARSMTASASDIETKLAHTIPFGKATFTVIFRLLDHFNLVPSFLIKNDPLFTSIYFANLGSIGLDTPYHHLYEWGTASMFVVMGKMFQKDVPRHDGSVQRRHFINFKVSIDERIADGLYFAHSASLFHRIMLHPEMLDIAAEPSEIY